MLTALSLFSLQSDLIWPQPLHLAQSSWTLSPIQEGNDIEWKKDKENIFGLGVVSLESWDTGRGISCSHRVRSRPNYCDNSLLYCPWIWVTRYSKYPARVLVLPQTAPAARTQAAWRHGCPLPMTYSAALDRHGVNFVPAFPPHWVPGGRLAAHITQSVRLAGNGAWSLRTVLPIWSRHFQTVSVSVWQFK